VILIGQGVKYGGAAAPPRARAEKIDIPGAWAAGGTRGIDSSHPPPPRPVCPHRTHPAKHPAPPADRFVPLGGRVRHRTSSSWLPGYSFTIPPTKLIHVDIDPDEIGRNYPVALGLMADVRTFLRQILGALDAHKDVSAKAAARAKWLDAIAGYRKEWEAF